LSIYTDKSLSSREASKTVFEFFSVQQALKQLLNLISAAEKAGIVIAKNAKTTPAAKN
jgi:hypothetical protein